MIERERIVIRKMGDLKQTPDPSKVRFAERELVEFSNGPAQFAAFRASRTRVHSLRSVPVMHPLCRRSGTHNSRQPATPFAERAAAPQSGTGHVHPSGLARKPSLNRLASVAMVETVCTFNAYTAQSERRRARLAPCAQREL